MLGDAATLKGGLVLELRLARARTTRDVDLRLTGSPDDVLANLQTAARLDLGDFFTFEVAPDGEHVVADDLLGFAGVAPPTLRVYPVETHIAEKLHAFTMPRARPNSRVKDLPDLALLAGVKPLDAARLRAALEQTFAFRKTPLPPALPPPPATWEMPYGAMAREDRLAWATLYEVTAAARAFLDPVLARDAPETWDPDTWRWT